VRAGFIGLGMQGLPIARRIAAAGIPTTVWARRASVAREAAEWGAEIAATPADLGRASDVVGICVFDADGVREVLFGQDGVIRGMSPGGIVIVHSTVAPSEIRAIAQRAEEYGIDVVDAPVSGGPDAAASGTLLVLLAGRDEAVEQALPVIETYAGRVARLADVGTAQLAKLFNNALLAAQVALVVDALRIGQERGLPAAGLLDVFRTGSARGFALELFANLGSMDKLRNSQFGPTIAKDVRLLSESIALSSGASSLLDLAENLVGELVAAS